MYAVTDRFLWFYQTIVITLFYSIVCSLQMQPSFSMKDNIKFKIYQLPDVIKDGATLNQLMEDVAFYAGKKDIMDELNQNHRMN